MTFLATLVLFAVALSLVWLATQRTGRQHECSCSRSRRVLAEYERVHSRACRGTRSVLIPSSEIARKPSKSVRRTEESIAQRRDSASFV